jgi:hypothetical protein
MAALMVIIFLPALANPKKFRKALKSFVSEKEAVRSTGGSLIILSAIFLAVQWKFSKDWTIIIPIFGWLTLVKGIAYLWSPNLVKKIVKTWKIYNTDGGIAIASIIAMALAAALIYIATEMLTGIELIAG